MAVERMLPAIFFYCEARFRAGDLFRLIDPALQLLEHGKHEHTHVRYIVILQAARASFYRNGFPVRFEAYGFFIPADEGAIIQAWTIAQQHGILEELGLWSIYLAYLYGRILERQTGAALLRTLAVEFRRQGQQWELAFCLYSLGALIEVILYEEQDTPELRQETELSLKEALSIFQGLGDQRESGNTQRTLGNLYLKTRNSARALDHWIGCPLDPAPGRRMGFACRDQLADRRSLSAAGRV